MGLKFIFAFHKECNYEKRRLPPSELRILLCGMKLGILN